MDKLKLIFDAIAGVVGGIVGFFFGGVTPLFLAVVAFMTVDYITGVLIAKINKNLSSEIGFKGLAKKFLILVFVALAHIIDVSVLNSAPILQSAVTTFFIANEGLSIIENAASLGVPIPKKLIDVLEQIKAKSDDDNDSN